MAAATSRGIYTWLFTACIVIFATTSNLYAADSQTALQSQLELAIGREKSLQTRLALAKFYQMKSWTLVWQAPELAHAAHVVLAAAPQQGLPAAPYAATSNARTTVDADVELSARVLRYATTVSMGVAPPSDAETPLRTGRAIASELALATRSPEDLRKYLAALPPDHAAYLALKRAYTRYLLLAAQGSWPQLPLTKHIKLSSPGPLVQLVYARLACEYPSLQKANLTALKKAIRRFQDHVGLAADGIIGPKTIRALNIEPAQRAAQIAANMERWRWLPRHFPARYIEINTANATLQAVDHGSIVLRSRIIVGKAATPTPDFTTDALAVIVNPAWDVPASIVQKEILPSLRRQPNYLTRNHMIMKNGSVKQLPGADNALGRIKIDIIDPFSIYMHDTPARSLFVLDERHLSHGCIRVQKILLLASWLLTGNLNEGIARIQAAIATGATRRIALRRPVSVYIFYRTVTVGSDGSVNFVPDVYDRDATLITTMFGSPPELSTAKQPASHGCKVSQ